MVKSSEVVVKAVTVFLISFCLYKVDFYLGSAFVIYSLYEVYLFLKYLNEVKETSEPNIQYYEVSEDEAASILSLLGKKSVKNSDGNLQ